jgi:hypothetical protein
MPQLLLAVSLRAGHSERSLTTTYETIAYYIHCSSSRLWLDDVMRQQERIGDDNRYDGQLNRGNDEEGYGREERDDKEGVNNHQEEHDQEEGGRRCLAGCIAVTSSVTAR